MPFLDRKNNRQVSEALAWGEDTSRLGSLSGHGLNNIGFGEPLVQAQRRLCGNADCASVWTMPWRSRRRPIFEDAWGCSGRCMLSIVQTALRRESGDGIAAAIPHHHRVPLGLLMLAQGWITAPQLRQGLEAQRQNGTGRIGEWLIAECGLEAEQITRGLSLQWNCPVLSLERFSPEMMALVMPNFFVDEFGLLPLRVAGRRILYLAFEDHLDASASLAIERMAELKVESGVLNEVQFRAARNSLLQCASVETKIEKTPDTDALAGRITAVLEQKQPVASRLVRLHQYYWLRLWLENGMKGNPGKLPESREDICDYVFCIA